MPPHRYSYLSSFPKRSLTSHIRAITAPTTLGILENISRPSQTQPPVRSIPRDPETDLPDLPRGRLQRTPAALALPTQSQRSSKQRGDRDKGVAWELRLRSGRSPLRPAAFPALMQEGRNDEGYFDDIACADGKQTVLRMVKVAIWLAVLQVVEVLKSRGCRKYSKNPPFVP